MRKRGPSLREFSGWMGVIRWRRCLQHLGCDGEFVAWKFDIVPSPFGDCVAIQQGEQILMRRRYNLPTQRIDMISSSARNGESMAYRYGDRKQMGWVPQRIEDHAGKQ